MSKAQHDRILGYLSIGVEEGAKAPLWLLALSLLFVLYHLYMLLSLIMILVLWATWTSGQVLTGGVAGDAVAGGYYIKPTILHGTNDMRVFQEEIFGPVTSVTTFKTEEEAIAIANNTTLRRH